LAGRYQLNSLLGRGGMGTVYKATDSQMSDRIVAIKVLAPHLVSDEKQVLRFEQEARAANQLRHPNTISVLDFGRDPAGHIFMVIEFLTGQELTSIVRKGPMDAARALYIMRQVCKSLAEAHSKGIVHRDLKPDNIFVCEIYGEKDFVKVIDFGIAKFLEDENANLTQAGKMFGTPRYLSPEQAQGKRLDNRSDLYTCGVILFECVSGRPPFVAEEAIAVAIKHVQEQPPKLSEVNPSVRVSAAVDKLIFRLLNKKPDARFQSAEEVVEAIDVAMTQLGPALGAYRPGSMLTPARPQTIPPASAETDDATRMMESVAEAEEPDETRFMDLPDTGSPPSEDATMALDSVSGDLLEAPSGGAEAATMALDTVGAAVAVEKLKSGTKKPEKKKAPAKAPAKPAPAESGGGKGMMFAVIGLLVIAVGGVGFMFMSKNKDANKPAAAAVAKTPKPDEAATKRLEVEANKARKAAAEAAEAVKELRAEKARLAKEAEAKAKAEADAKKEVVINSTPPGAKLFINEIEVGTTPYKLQVTMKTGDQKLKLVLDGHQDLERVLTNSQIGTLITTNTFALSNELKKKVVAVAKPAPAKPKKRKKKAKGNLDFGGF